MIMISKKESLLLVLVVLGGSVVRVGADMAQADDTVWLEARALCRKADALPEDEAAPVYEQAYKKAQEAVVVEPQSAAPHYYLGLTAAKIARHAGAFSKLKYVHETEREMQKVIQIEPGFSDAGAYRILGKIDYEMPGALGGSNKRAKEYLEKAVALAPGNALNHLYLAEVLQAMGDKKGARAEAFRVTVMPSEGETSRDGSPKDKAQKLLDSLGD